MDEEKVRENDVTTARPNPISLPPDVHPVDQPSSEHGSEDTFLSLSPDGYSGHKNVENISISPNVDKNGSNELLEKHDPKVGSPNVDKNGSNKQPEKNDSKVGSTSPNVDKNGSNIHPEKHDSKVGSPNVDKNGSDKQTEKDEAKVHHIDTAAPFESVKEAVSKFGVIVDWKAHRAQTSERRQYIEHELEKAEKEIPVFKQKAELAEQEKEQALRDLDSTKRLIHQLKLNLERAQTEERQAKQDSELANLRVQEMEQGIADESSVAAKTQLEVAKARHQAAASELITATNELEETRKDYQILISERDSATQKAQEAVSAAKEIERQVEDLTIQLITTKESIESTHASHLEAEEQRYQEAKEQDEYAINLDVEIKQTEEELEKVNEQIVLAKDMRTKLETSSGLLRNLKDELAVYMQGKVPEVDEDEQFTRKDIQSGIAVAKKELDEVKIQIERTNEEVMCLKTTATSLTAKLESEKKVLTDVRKQKGLGAGAVVNLESELKRTRLELDNIRKREKEAREKLAELPKQLRKVSEEAEKARSLADEAHSKLKKAKDTAEEAKTGVDSQSDRLAAIQKQIDAARAQEKIALGAINALNESQSKSGKKNEDLKGAVTISLQEYYDMSKRAYAAEEAANKRVEEAAAKIDEAKDSEMQSLNKLTKVNQENAARKDALNAALQKAEMAKESTESIQEELKKRKGEDGGETQKPEAAPAPRVGLFKRLSQKGGLDAASPSSTPANPLPDTKGGGPDANGNADESATEGKGFFRRRKKLQMPNVMPKMSFINMKKKPLFGRNSNS
ncbi:putative WEB family protein [Helianthus annuus]|nr:putative WEB family protein [Helianthus annuus]KAJ0756641.1 putative WEB family protein [Helianthus annuus]KAJ0760389.1 putative WEB family protein [Helianthus annuus]KAJ0930183.1 putative WEB family protein [Helianthus annuus]